jgi:voltage-gated potassium channel
MKRTGATNRTGVAARFKKNALNAFMYLDFIRNSGSYLPLLLILGLLLSAVLAAFFLEERVNEGFRNLWDAVWWMFVTITTTGYGDRYPVTVGGRIAGIVIMLLGVTTVGLVAGRITSFLVDRQIRARGGLIVLGRKKGHFVVCGWKGGFEDILRNILRANPRLKASDLVLVNDADPAEINNIRSIQDLRFVKYIKGDYIEEQVLKRANIQDAATALVLADSSRSFSQEEVDSRTVMTVITIDSLNRNIYICAEIIDDKYEKYLRLANCDEIILTRDLGRVLIANAASASGISHIAAELLRPEGKLLDTEEIPDELVGRTFKDLRSHYEGIGDRIVIGLLENTGKILLRKKEALAEAQKTTNIDKLVENLQNVKKLSPNRPVLNPGSGYVIKRNAKAIVIARGGRDTAGAG